MAEKPRTRKTSSRKRLRRATELRGTAPADAFLALDAPEVSEVAGKVAAAGGRALSAYRDPLSGKPLVLAALPLASVQPTPFQRELSPTHTKRLAQKIDESGAFLDPIIAVVGPDEKTFWTPIGRHRLAAAGVLGLRAIMALVSVDPDLAFKILALNTEKAHNLRDRSLEVIRMARARATLSRPGVETDYAAEFESPAFLTLGILYEGAGRFAGGAYLPLLRKVDRFEGAQGLRVSLRHREGLASRLAAIDRRVGELVAKLQERGFRSPYLKPFVVARINPVRWVKPTKKADAKPPMPLGEALTRMARSAKDFKVETVSQKDLAMVAALAPPVSE